MKFLSKNILSVLLLFFILALLYSALSGTFQEKGKISLSELVQKINAGEVQKILVSGENVEVTLIDGTIAETRKEFDASFTQTLFNYGVAQKALSKLELDIKEPSGFMFWLGAILPFLIPFLLIVAFFWFMSRQVRSSATQAFTFGQSRARLVGPDKQKESITFKDVAGVKEAKEELWEIVEFLKNPKKFWDIGARIPRGVLLMGAPGSGKTLLARAVAGEASVPFFHISASEFVEMFVGVGAARVRDLFKVAKKAAPAIVFIDEIDAVGRHRGAGVGGGHDEREQTLNQILVEMDGFETRESVIVIAATNRPDVLDPALLRPGRFDRRVILDLPDINDREEILKIHAKNKPFEKGVNLRVIAERTPGFSGADLQNLMNEGAILAARRSRKKVIQADLIESIEKVLLGPERKSNLLTKKEKEISAYHEAGHALVAAALPHADPVHKVSIVSRGRAAGYTLKLPTEDRHLYSRSHFMDDIAVSLGGYVAEDITFSEITTGASDDLKKATAVARDLVARYGMSGLGLVVWDRGEDEIFLGREMVAHKNYSEKFAARIDDEVRKVIARALRVARDVLKKHKSVLEAIARHLIEKETIERAEFEKLVASMGLKVVKVQN